MHGMLCFLFRIPHSAFLCRAVEVIHDGGGVVMIDNVGRIKWLEEREVETDATWWAGVRT